MSPDIRHREFGTPMGEWIATMPAELDDIGLGLGSIVADGIRGFGLSGSELTDFVRKCLHSILRAGGQPIRWMPDDGGGRWQIETTYGSTPDEIVEGVIRDWLRSGIVAPSEWTYRFGPRSMLPK